MPTNMSDLIERASTLASFRENRRRLQSGELRQKDFEDMGVSSPVMDFVGEMLDPTLWATMGGAGAIHAARFGKPVLKAALEWADPFQGIPKLVGSWFKKPETFRRPVGSTMAWIEKGGRSRPAGTKKMRVYPEEVRKTMGEMFKGGPLERRAETSEVWGQPTKGLLEAGMEEGEVVGQRAIEAPWFGTKGLLSKNVPRGTMRMPGGTQFPEVVGTKGYLTAGDIPGEIVPEVKSIMESFIRPEQPIEKLMKSAEALAEKRKLFSTAKKLLGKQTKISTKPEPAILLKDGTIVKGEATHSGIYTKMLNEDPESIKDVGWFFNGKFTNEMPKVGKK